MHNLIVAPSLAKVMTDNRFSFLAINICMPTTKNKPQMLIREINMEYKHNWIVLISNQNLPVIHSPCPIKKISQGNSGVIVEVNLMIDYWKLVRKGLKWEKGMRNIRNTILITTGNLITLDTSVLLIPSKFL